MTAITLSELNHDSCHIYHLFEKPLCKNQKQIVRIANIAFHIFTLGIPYILYHATCSLLSINISKIKQNKRIDNIVKKAETYVAQTFPEHTTNDQKEIVSYIKDKVTSDNFLDDPSAGVAKWKEDRGYTEEYRFPEDRAKRFFERIPVNK